MPAAAGKSDLSRRPTPLPAEKARHHTEQDPAVKRRSGRRRTIVSETVLRHCYAPCPRRPRKQPPAPRNLSPASPPARRRPVPPSTARPTMPKPACSSCRRCWTTPAAQSPPAPPPPGPPINSSPDDAKARVLELQAMLDKTRRDTAALTQPKKDESLQGAQVRLALLEKRPRG